jgi:uncharacterized Zn-finger protein
MLLLQIKPIYLIKNKTVKSGEKPYGCDYCEKRFTQLSHLWQHTRRHTGDRPYKCEFSNCDKSFTQLSNLQSHLRTHGITTPVNPNPNVNSSQVSNSNPNQTNNQSTAGSSSSNSSLASAAHPANASKCTKCYKAFATKEELQMHVLNKHGGKMSSQENSKKNNSNNNGNKKHHCEICHKRFATEGVIRQHLCARQPNIAFVRNNEGGLVLKASGAQNTANSRS